jgi:hypothetical protein
VALHGEIASGARPSPLSVIEGMVLFRGRLYIPPTSPLLQEILRVVHEDGHEGV